MAMLNSLIRRILGPLSFPRYPQAPAATIPQTYQETPQGKPTSVPVVVNPPPV